jgi:hypothetical protein
MWEWRCSSTILDISIRWMWVVSFMPRMICPQRNRPWVPGVGLRARLDAVEKRKLFSNLESNPRHPVSSPSLYHLSCHYSETGSEYISSLVLNVLTIIINYLLASLKCSSQIREMNCILGCWILQESYQSLSCSGFSEHFMEHGGSLPCS